MKTLSLNSASVSKPVFEEAWICLLGFYGRAFETQYGNIDGEQFRLWLAGLNSNGVTDDMVAAATRAVPAEHARKTSHAPNFADFLRLCMSSKPGAIISDDQAYHEAHSAVRSWSRHSWSSAAVYQATLAVGVWWMRQYPEKVTRPKFIEAYHKLLEQERAGDVLAAPPVPEAMPDRQIARTEDPNRAVRAAERRGRMAALNKALLELPDAQMKIATGALKDERYVSADELFPPGSQISPVARAVLLEYCCNIKADADDAASLILAVGDDATTVSTSIFSSPPTL